MPISRRTLLKSSAIAASAYGAELALPSVGRALAGAPKELIAYEGNALLTGETATGGMMSYRLGTAGEGAPPVLRMRKGEEFSARLVNRLKEPTTVHWHGLRIANAMDGVPEMTQPYVYPGDTFDYRFTPPDAGTFWYHPHCNTLTQMGRGLTGVIVVEDPADPVFDAEIVLNLRDFRLGGDGQFIAPFKPRDAARSGTFGTVRTTNWRAAPAYDAPAGGLVRVRIAATDVTRVYRLALEGGAGKVIALDGNPLQAPIPLDLQDVGPGQRLDFVLRMPDTEGEIATLTNVKGSTPWTVASFRAVGASAGRSLEDVGPLPANPIPVADLKAAEIIPMDFTATAEHGAKESICGSLGYTFWAINRVAWPGDTADGVAPLAELKRGRSYIFRVANRTPHTHPVHLHGMSFHIVASNQPRLIGHATDTILLQPDETADLALVADNPGAWMLHCHIIEHQKTGMSSYVTVT
ncbi:FtsP/CotA-like multicopper oxidase with cupredoxin domain [Rhizobium azooxidifex]|uniref:FtsP/CotA-like multicopper oxidase with cupredoxin domain n=1 Tax=Mycoplana azooxidifex TaxID=1636188 RepID=A0A7W6D8X1_9HYPH|nr:multicopper oxidase family protein [Mycoplana azooxidifex]MBB3978850.1 FtsP/CotA-like multicopper oxidase with cupredoxin domain [Mycoplana azooxidifex]